MSVRTKQWIAETMKKLMTKKPLDKIRVTEICREAEIERPTFYYHFRDKYELVAWIFCRRAFETDILSIESAAKAMNAMRQDYIFINGLTKTIRRTLCGSTWSSTSPGDTGRKQKPSSAPTSWMRRQNTASASTATAA